MTGSNRGVSIGLAIASLGLVGGAIASSPDPVREKSERKVDFNREVLPILSEHCFRCHGPDAASVAAGLRLDGFDTATADRGGYKAIAPGNSAESRVYQRLTAAEDYMRMPPVDSGVAALSKDQIETIRLWIESGAEYKKHWAFVAPESFAPPRVKDHAWAKNDLDLFVLAKLEESGLAPESEADKQTLARRAALTLTGLPPAPEELEAFLADKGGDAYERYVDRLLASPRYGEHQARYWLDAVRYGDTHGLHLDNERSIWPYRDWVVRAFNQDLTYDKFAVWQLAGDLLPNPTTEQLIATGFVRMNPTTAEGGAIEEEFLVKNTFDRVDTAATVFLGLTVGCAKCHDHKYDPITQEEYYGLFAYFNSTTDSPLDGNLLAPEPAIKAATPEQDALLSSWRSELRAIEARVDRAAATAWLAGEHAEPVVFSKWELAGPYSGTTFDEVFVAVFDPEKDENSVQWRDAGIELGKLRLGLIGKDNSAAYLRGTVTVSRDQEVELRLGSDDGIKLWVNGKLVHNNRVLRSLTPDADRIKVALKKGTNALFFKVVNAGGGDGVYIAYGDPRQERIDQAYALAKKPSLSAAETQTVAATYLELGPESDAAKSYRGKVAMVAKLESSLPVTLVAREMEKPRVTRLLNRGEYDQPKQEVQRHIPAVLGKLPEGAPNNRLGLAQWLISDEDPLFERVFVNRVWQQHFGNPLVGSPENFGLQGDYPTHPELLDFLSREFRKGGFSIKALHRAIVTSATFRQASKVSAEKLERDPQNALLSRGPRFRLDAEALRDLALFASGTLVEKMGGRGVKTYQPEGLWEAVAYPTSNTARYEQDHGDALYRRSLYLFWKRTSPPPAMATFDAPSREACIVLRSRTNTPLQALVTMNGPQFVEAARNMAQRVMLAEKSDIDRIRLAFLLATSRQPTDAETKVIAGVLANQRTGFRFEPDEATKLLSVGESKRDESLDAADHAAWTMVCNMILNLDEAVTQH